MPSFRRRGSVVDADHVDAPAARNPVRTEDLEFARALAEAAEAEAEAAEAKALAAAARARARAIELGRHVEAGTSTPTEADAEAAESEVADAEVAEAGDVDEGATADGGVSTEAGDRVDDSTDGSAPDDSSSAPARTRRLRLPRPSWRSLAVAVVVVCTLALMAASGYMVWHHREAVQRTQQNAEYLAGAKQGIVNLMTLNYNKADEDVQRILDNSTGKFKEDFQAQAQDFVRVAKEAKVITDVTVNAAAVDSMTDDSAVVLVAATSRVTNSAGAKAEARSFRLSVSVQREGDRIKMSRVEFVP